MKQWKQSIEKQRKLEHYFYKEWQDSAQMAEKRQTQLEIAQEADAEELIEQASNELAGYEELAREYEESYNEQKERVKKIRSAWARIAISPQKNTPDAIECHCA